MRTRKIAALVLTLIASAYLMTLAIGSADFRWLGWVTLLPLFFCIKTLAPLHAFGAGALWGLCLCIFSGLGADASIAPTLRSFALLTAIPGLYAYVAARVTRRVGFSPLLLGFGWVGVEFALQPLALRNGLLAGTQGDGLVIRTLGDLAGYTLVAFLVAYVNASFLSMLSDACATGSPPRVMARSVHAYQRWFPTESPAYHLLAHVLPSQPRAPPA